MTHHFETAFNFMKAPPSGVPFIKLCETRQPVLMVHFQHLPDTFEHNVFVI